MDWDREDNFGSGEGSGGAGPPPIPVARPLEPRRKGSGWKVFWGVVLALSVFANIILFLALVGTVAVFAAGRERMFMEEVIRKGPRTAKIAVVSINGIIDDEQSRGFWQQMKAVAEDKYVKGVIVRVNSPGGTISGSDEIHNEILKYRAEQGKPVVAFMQGMAASGGYYTSVACERIVAEPTTITGSIGVIMGYLVLEELLEEKLGIQPVIVTGGEKKDWVSSFRAPTEEQLEYIDQRVVRPAYERFVQVVTDGRESLSAEQVGAVADGGIYTAPQALEEGLIDEIGYMDDAIKAVLTLAGIEEAQVVEYRRLWSFAQMLGAEQKGLLSLSKSDLYELCVPQVMYLWTTFE